MKQTIYTSPTIEALRKRLAEGHEDALEAFWRDVERNGTPLIEPADDEDYRLVTFLWREREPVEHVAVIGEFVDYERSGRVMSRLPRTDILHKTYRFRSDLRTCYELSPNDPLTPMTWDENWDERSRTWQVDPLNPRRYRVNVVDKEDPESKEKYLSVLELPSAPPQPWVQTRPGGLAGKMRMTRLKSKILEGDRRVWIYTPPDHDPATGSYPAVVLTDGIPYTRIMSAQTTLDNLILEGEIPPTVGIFVDNPDRFSDLGCSQPFADFLAVELMPAMRERYGVMGNPAGIVIGGTSLGGVNAMFVALRYSEVFGGVLSQSGAFQWTPGTTPPESPQLEMEEPEWLARQFAFAETGPIRFYMDVGILELNSWGPGHPSLLTSNRHLRDVLLARGYTVDYKEFNGAHNYIVWQGTLAAGLISLLAGKTEEGE